MNSHRLDIAALEYISVSKPEWNIVLVGPEDEKFRNSNLHAMDNVHFLGSKKENHLPAYLSGFDVAINPQSVNELTAVNYPRKIDEYLAMGKPVVATLTDTMGYFKDYVSLVKSYEDWVNAIQKELETDSTEKQESRRMFASDHTWENNVKRIFEYLEAA